MTTITYGMTGAQVRAALLANFNEIENYSLGTGEAIITDVTTGQTVANFMTAINTKFTQLALRVAKASPGHTEVSAATVDIATVLNSNFTLFDGYADTFLADGVPFWLDVIQKTIPTKGTANILAQQDSYKLGYFTGENILYLSADNGATWPYSIAFASGCDQIRNAWVFKNGRVFIGIRENKIFYSSDLLSTLPEITCKDTDGNNLVFHEPVNALYPGAYFSTFRGNSFVKDGVEVYIFGTYPHHENYGAAPTNIYRVRDDNAECKVIYQFGQNPNTMDDGTGTGAGTTGNLLGDAGNANIAKHFHYTGFDQFRNEAWVQTGDEQFTTWWIKIVPNIAADTFDLTLYDLGNTTSYSRATGMVFYNAGNTIMWSSDQNGNIYTVAYANLNTTIANHTVKYDGARNLLGMSPYGEKMLAIGGPETPGTLVVSVDYGETWSLVADNYMNLIGALTTKFLSRLWEVDSDGYALVHRSQIVPLYAKESYLIKIKDKPVH